jgi:phenylacetic acid degradation operon negative regulatory protein
VAAPLVADVPFPIRPWLTPRSAVFDLFGDYVRYHGGEIRLRALVALAEALGVRGGTTRVALSRMRDEAWFTTRRHGREAWYALTGQCLALLDDGRDRIFTRCREPWDGRWSMAIYAVPETERATREKLRKRLQWLGFGALAPSTWISPHDRLPLVAEAAAALDGVRLDLLTMNTTGLPADRDLAARCWNLAALDVGYRKFLRTYRPRLAGYRNGLLAGRDALVERVVLVRSYRKFPFADPDLPDELVPAGWVGRDAHQIFLEAHELLRDPAEAYYRDVLAQYE